MEEMVNPHSSCDCSSDPCNCALATSKDSHIISKFKPKIRIVHIVAPEIIKTDAANFRELVQRLTGKPSDPKGRRKKAKVFPSKDLPILSKSAELPDVFPSLQNGERIKEEVDQEVWGGENLHGFLDGFADVEGFIRELSEIFP